MHWKAVRGKKRSVFIKLEPQCFVAWAQFTAQYIILKQNQLKLCTQTHAGEHRHVQLRQMKWSVWWVMSTDCLWQARSKSDFPSEESGVCTQRKAVGKRRETGSELHGSSQKRRENLSAVLQAGCGYNLRFWRYYCGLFDYFLFLFLGAVLQNVSNSAQFSIKFQFL